MRQQCRPLVFVLLLIACLSLTGCDGGDDDADHDVEALMGTYRGTRQDSRTRDGALFFTIARAQVGTDGIVGTWIIRATNPDTMQAGSLSGNVRGDRLSVTLQPYDLSTCPYTANGTASGAQISGSYVTFSCTESVTGTFQVTRQ